MPLDRAARVAASYSNTCCARLAKGSITTASRVILGRAIDEPME
jgi:hypothetical protein